MNKRIKKACVSSKQALILLIINHIFLHNNFVYLFLSLSLFQSLCLYSSSLFCFGFFFFFFFFQLFFFFSELILFTMDHRFSSLSFSFLFFFSLLDHLSVFFFSLPLSLCFFKTSITYQSLVVVIVGWMVGSSCLAPP